MRLNQLVNILNTTLTLDPPVKTDQGGIIADGISEDLDNWRKIAKGGQEWILKYQQKLIEETNIANLKIKYNQVFGYFIEISDGQKHKVGANFIRKQTLSNCERFTTEELMNYQEKVIKAESEVIRIENELFNNLCAEVLNYSQDIQALANEIAEIDVLASFAELAQTNNYCCPTLTTNNVLEIKNGRHPVIETLTKNFIPNNSSFSEQERFVLLSGPNMAGKSTYLRQNALIIYLAHIGCFVPATSAKIGVVDRIFTRVGAGDNLSAGESTFMIEMLEASTILHNATERSFIILDELGRGTSTFDGLSLAWAMSEYIHNHIKAKCIFATHYHELIMAIDQMPHAQNYSVAVIENEKDGVVFLHKIVKGGADKSYGIEVAKLAGVPFSVLERAKNILQELENKKAKQEENLQLSLFYEENEKNEKNIVKREVIKEKIIIKESIVEEKLKTINLNNLTPLEALNILAELKKII